MATPTTSGTSADASMESSTGEVTHHQVVVVGGGTAGITVAARLIRRRRGAIDVAIVDPASDHFYQPAWTLVGGGAFRPERTRRPEASVIPPGATWIQAAVEEFDPEHSRLKTAVGQWIEYDSLVVAAGIRLKWNAIKGLQETLGRNGVCSNYSFETASYTWQCIREFSGGNAIFTQPPPPIKCGGAPQKICYLAEDYFRSAGVRDKSRIIFASAEATIFAVEKYRKVLERVIERKGIETMYRYNLIAVSPDTKEAIFENLETGDELALQYDMIHVTPPQGPPDFIASSPLADAGGWVDVDQYTLQHRRYENVFALGDCANLPTSKTGAAIRKQAPVVVNNLQALLAGDAPAARYSGYTSCPLVTGYGKLVLAEFDYDKQPEETFPFDQAKERYSMYLLKKYGLPLLYWQGMLKGRA